MKLSRIIILLIIASTFGCMQDKRDDCPDGKSRLTLLFEYYDFKGRDVFSERIDEIDVVLFNESLNYYEKVHLDTTHLNKFRGVEVMLYPGTYHVVCWANVFGQSEMTELNQTIVFDDSYVKHTSKITADPLHYAPYDPAEYGRSRAGDMTKYSLSMPETGEQTKTLSFMSAHRTIMLYLHGWEDPNDPMQYPIMTLDDISSQYDFYLDRNYPKKEFEQTTEYQYINGKDMVLGKFYVPNFDQENNINAVVRSATTNDIIFEYSLEKFMKENDIIVEEGDNMTIKIYVEFDNGVLVRITLPDWESNEVDPSFD